MVSLFALCWPTVDPVLDHAKDVANVCIVLDDVAQSLEGDLFLMPASPVWKKPERYRGNLT